MVKEIIFNKELFSKIIKSHLSDLESETIKKLRAVMKAEAANNADKVNVDMNKLLSDFKKTVTISPEPAKNITFPDKVYSAIMQRVIAVEAPKITGGELAAGSIIQSIGGYISEILNPNTEIVEGYTLSNPFGSTLAYVTVTAPDGKSYNFSWNDSKTKESFKSFMKKLSDFAEERATVGIFTALLDDARNAGLIASGKDLLSKWIKSFKDSRELNKLVSELTASKNDWNFFGKLAAYKNSKNPLIDSVVAEFSKDFKTIAEPYKLFIKKINNSLGKLLEKVESTVEWLDNLTYELFSDSKTSIKNIRKKYDAFIEKSIDLASEIADYNGSDESFIATLSQKSSAYQNFIEACNALETEIGTSKTYFDPTFEEYISYKISDVHNETITENHSSVTGTSQNDTMNIQGHNVKVYGGEGDDDIIASSRYITLIGEQGKDHFLLREIANKNYVDAGADDDTILSYGSNNTIYGGDGNDSILISAYSDFTTEDEVRGGYGDDMIEITAAIKNTVLGEAGDDFIHVSGEAKNNTIIGGKGNDTIALENADSNFIVYSADDDNDTVFGFNANDTLYIAEGDFSRSTINSDVEVSVGYGSILLKDAANKNLNIIKPLTFDDLFKDIQSNKIIFGTQQNDDIENALSEATIDAGAGNDSIDNYGDTVTIISGSGDDSVYNGGVTSSINAGEGNDSIFNQGDYATIIADAGDDTIYNGYSSYSSVSTNSFISGGEGNDSVDNWGDSVIIDGNDGNDTISNAGVNSSISGGDGDDTIDSSGASSTLDGGEGNDSIKSWSDYVTINGGTGNDSIHNEQGDSVSINGGEGNDSISNSWNSYDVTINGGDGDDSIVNSDASSHTIIGGNGNDYILNEYGGYLSINGGEGDDTIENIAAIFSGRYVHGGDNVTINAEEGNDLISFSEYAYDNITLYNAGDGNDTIEGFNSWDTLSISGGSYSTTKSGDDIIVTVGDGKISLVGAANLDEINIEGEEEDLTKLTFDNKTDSELTLPAQAEVADASQRTKPIQITGNTLANSLFGGKKNDTLDGAGGNNTLTGGNVNDVFIHNDGNDIITDYDKKDKISVGSAYEDFNIDGKDLIFYFGEENTLTIQGGAGKAVNLNSNTNCYVTDALLDAKQKSATISAEADTFNAMTYSKLVTIDGSTASDEVNIVGNKKSNVIIAGNHDATLNGGKGRDTLCGGTGTDTFVYENRSGKDIIENYAEGEIISLGGGVVIKDVALKRNDTIIKFKSGSMTVKDTSDKKITVVQNGLNTIFSAGIAVDEDEDFIKAFPSFKGTINLNEYEVSTADAALAKKSVTINGSDDDNYLISGKGKDYLSGGAGADTLWGGKGNDTLFGGEGSDTFIFQAGGGNDVITDYANGDLIQILDRRGNIASEPFKKATFSDDTLTLSIKSGGKLSFNGVNSSTNFNINSASYGISGNTLVRK